MSHIPPSTPTDIVFIDTLHLNANVGPDCWGKARAQPVNVSVYLHLTPGFLKTAGESDGVEDSVHYGLLTKKVAALVKNKDGEGEREFGGIDELVRCVAEEAFELGGAAVGSVRVVVELPKVVLLAGGGLAVDVVVLREGRFERKRVEVRGVVVPVVIGVNPPERLAKQRVVVDLVFYEGDGEGEAISQVGYQGVVEVLCKDIEASSYLTLEALVHDLSRTAFKASSKIEAVTIRARKPSALSVAEYSGVEVTRRR
ncbi:Dihydroneopterin aldolase-domain-containing protein, partial [Ephemerocybe angulata]